MKKFLILLIILLISNVSLSQTGEYKGTLLLKNLNVPVEGITVKVKGGMKYTTSTNHKGDFYIKAAKYPFLIIFSHKMYIKSKFTVKSPSDSTFFISMTTGKRSRDNISASGASVSVKIRETDVEYSSILQRLSSIPGVIVSGSSVTIRGGSGSIRIKTPPLILIDGQRFHGSLTDTNIPPAMIDKIKVVRGADAAAYGMSGNSGVIIITTKSR